MSGLLSPRNDNPIDWVSPVNWRHPLSRGLGMWLAGANGSLGGSRMLDLCRNRVATLVDFTNPQTWTGRRLRDGLQGLEFNGSTSEVQLPTLPLTNKYTLKVSLRLRALGNLDGILGFTNGFASLRCSASDIRLVGTNGSTFVSFGTPTVGADHLVSVSYDGTTVTTYLNGIQQNQDTSTSLYDVQGLDVIGRDHTYGSGRILDGWLSSVMVWPNRAFTAAEHEQLYRSYQQGYPDLLNRIYVPTLASQEAGGNRRRRVLICGRAA